MKKLGRNMVAACLFSLVGVGAAHADSSTVLKVRTVQMDEKGDFTELLALPEGKAVTATTDGTMQTDVHLFVYDASNAEIGKDVSPGPQCNVQFTPVKAGLFKFVVKNEGPGGNSVTLKVAIAN